MRMTSRHSKHFFVNGARSSRTIFNQGIGFELVYRCVTKRRWRASVTSTSVTSIQRMVVGSMDIDRRGLSPANGRLTAEEWS